MRKSSLPEELYIYIFEKNKFLFHQNENEVTPLLYPTTGLITGLEMNDIVSVPRDYTLSSFQSLLGKITVLYI